jgi:V-type H+-transporting ATPase subunit C
MSKNNKYLFLSVPSSITLSGHKDDAIQALQKAVNEGYGTVQPLSVPEFKVGTLDGLIQQTEDLGRLQGLCDSVVAKVGDCLKNILDGNEEKMSQHKSVNDSMSSKAVMGLSGSRPSRSS